MQMRPRTRDCLGGRGIVAVRKRTPPECEKRCLPGSRLTELYGAGRPRPPSVASALIHVKPGNSCTLAIPPLAQPPDHDFSRWQAEGERPVEIHWAGAKLVLVPHA